MQVISVSNFFINRLLITLSPRMFVKVSDCLGTTSTTNIYFKSYSLFAAALFVKRFSFSFTRFEQLFFLINAEEHWILLERFETRLVELRLFLKTPIIIILNTILIFFLCSVLCCSRNGKFVFFPCLCLFPSARHCFLFKKFFSTSRTFNGELALNRHSPDYEVECSTLQISLK